MMADGERLRARRWRIIVLAGIVSAVLSPGDGAQIKQAEGSDVTLKAEYKGVPSEIIWKVNGNKVVEMNLIPKLEPHFYRLRDRANISDTDGSLTIRNLQVEDSGLYKAEALVENSIVEDTFISLTVIACPAKPTISDDSMDDNLKLTCKSNTSGVTYEWNNQTAKVGEGAIYTSNQPSEDVTLTCLVYVDKDACKNATSKTIRVMNTSESGRSRDGLLAAIIILVLLVIIIAGLLYVCRKLGSKPEPQIEKGETKSLLDQKGSQNGSQPEEEKSKPDPEGSQNGSQPEEEKSKPDPEGSQNGSQPEEEKAEPDLGGSKNGSQPEEAQAKPDPEGGKPELPLLENQNETTVQIEREVDKLEPRPEEGQNKTAALITLAESKPGPQPLENQNEITVQIEREVDKLELQQKEEQNKTAALITLGGSHPGSQLEEEQTKRDPEGSHPGSQLEEEQAKRDPEGDELELQLEEEQNDPLEQSQPVSQPEEEEAETDPAQSQSGSQQKEKEEKPSIEPRAKISRLTLILSSKGEVHHYKFQKAGTPSIEATLGERVDGQTREIKSLRLSVNNVNPEDSDDYSAEAQLSNGETIKIPKEDSDMITFNFPAKDVTKVTLKKNDDDDQCWELRDHKLHSGTLTLEPHSVTIDNLEPKDSGIYEINVNDAENSITRSTFKLEVVDLGNKDKIRYLLKLVKEVTPENEHLTKDPIGNITLHPAELPNDVQVTWMMDGEQLEIENGRIQLQPNGDLTINNVTLADSGKYTFQCDHQELKQEFVLTF